MILGETGVVLIGHAEVVPEDMALLDVQADVIELILAESVKRVDAHPGENLAAALDILEGVSNSLLPDELLKLRWQVRAHKMSMHGFEGCLEGGQHIFMRVAHNAIGDLYPALRVELVGQCDLLLDKLYLSAEVQGDIG